MTSVCRTIECDGNGELTCNLGPPCLFVKFHDGKFFRELLTTGEIEAGVDFTCWQGGRNALVILKMTTATSGHDCATFETNDQNVVETVKITHRVTEEAFEKIVQTVASGHIKLATVTVGIERLCEKFIPIEQHHSIYDRLGVNMGPRKKPVPPEGNVTIAVSNFVYGFEMGGQDVVAPFINGQSVPKQRFEGN